MSDNSADVVEVLLSNVKSVFSLNYILVSLLTVIVYDTILTMPKEIKFLWGTEGVSLRKVLYIICRYYAIICLVVMVKVSLGVDSSLKSCQIYTDWYTSAGLPIEEALVNMLLILRINALYGGRRKVLFFISTLFLVELGCFFYAGVKAGKVVPFAPLPTGLSLPGCIIHIPRTPKFTFTLLAWVPALIFSAILLGFSIYKVREDLSPVTSSTSGRFTSMHLYHPLLLAILRQGAIFYAVNTLITLINATFVIRIHDALNTVAVPLGIVAYSICGCRFLLSFHDLSDNFVHDAEDTNGIVVFQNLNNTMDETYVLQAL